MSVLKTALYCRFTKDDMVQGDSESIKTQKAMLTQYAKEQGFWWRRCMWTMVGVD